MKKMKKVLAVLLTLAMVLGMSMTTLAATAPKSNDAAPAQVYGVEAGATVTAYQIVKGSYNDNGLYGYEKAKGDLAIADVKAPTYAEIMAIAADINAKIKAETAVELVSKSMTMAEGSEYYTADLETGYWIVLVRGTGATIYNPMLMGVYYVVREGNNVLFADDVTAGDNWTISADVTVAKKTTTQITKDADRITQDTNGDVNYTVETVVPDYSAEYTDILFKVKDTLTNLTLQQDTIKIYAATKEEVADATAEELAALVIASENYAMTSGEKNFEIDFKDAWVLENGTQEITITYTAKIDATAINEIPGENHVELFYTNNPNENNGHDEDKEKVYSLVLDVFKKTGQDDKAEALDGAEFTLYTDAACTVPYTNGQFAGTVVSDGNGRMVIKGLDVGTYYIKETKAPAGYTLNTAVYEIVIDAEIEGEEIVSWTIKTTEVGKAESTKTNTYTVTEGEAAEGQEPIVTVTRDGADVVIANTKLLTLPSTGGIGTTIFTIAGCMIMIAAAAMFIVSRKKEAK